MPSAATAAKWQLVIDPAKLWLVVEIKNGEAKKASCKLCTKWQNKVRRSRNYNDALMLAYLFATIRRYKNIATQKLRLLHKSNCA